MKNIFILLSHKITPEQEKEIYEDLKCKNIFYLSEDLQKIWSNINPEGGLPLDKISEIVQLLNKESKEGDYILVQGDVGAVFYIVDWCFKNDRIPIYATTKRIFQEEKLPDGSIRNTHIFKHENFRKFVQF